MATRTATLYANAYPNGPELSPLGPAQVTASEQRQRTLHGRFASTDDPVEKGRILTEAATAAHDDGLIDPNEIDSAWSEDTSELVSKLANDRDFRDAVVATTAKHQTDPEWFGTDAYLYAQEEAARRRAAYWERQVAHIPKPVPAPDPDDVYAHRPGKAASAKFHAAQAAQAEHL